LAAPTSPTASATSCSLTRDTGGVEEPLGAMQQAAGRETHRPFQNGNEGVVPTLIATAFCSTHRLFDPAEGEGIIRVHPRSSAVPTLSVPAVPSASPSGLGVPSRLFIRVYPLLTLDLRPCVPAGHFAPFCAIWVPKRDIRAPKWAKKMPPKRQKGTEKAHKATQSDGKGHKGTRSTVAAGPIRDLLP